MFSLKIGQVADVLKTQGAQLLLPVAALHAAAFFLGYQISKFSFGESTSRTISIECGMQVVIFLYFSAYQWTNLCSHPNTCLVFYSLWFHLSRTIFISSSWAPYITILRRIIWWVPNRVIVKIINHAKHYLVYVSIFRGGKIRSFYPLQWCEMCSPCRLWREARPCHLLLVNGDARRQSREGKENRVVKQRKKASYLLLFLIKLTSN